MAKVTLVLVYYNHRRFVDLVFKAMLAQTYPDKEIVVVISGNDDGGKQYIQEHYPEVTVIDPGYNIGFAGGHNLVFQKHPADFYQLVNPDLVMEPDYVEKLVQAFNNPQVGAATGKLLKYDFERNERTDVIDSTGVTIAKSGRARDRGQHEVDRGQYDQLTDVQGVSGAGCMYRASALQAVRIPRGKKQETRGTNQLVTGHMSPVSKYEYFDEDFHSYWEDVDLSWRMVNAGWKCRFVPEAVAYHGRGVGSTKGGYVHVIDYVKHHSKVSPRIKQLNYKNHIFMYVKNSRWFYPQFFVREAAMLAYILLFEWSTLKVIPEMFRLLPKMWKKRKMIQDIRKLGY